MNAAPRNRLFQVPKPTHTPHATARPTHRPSPAGNIYVVRESRSSSVLTTVLIFAAMAMAAWFLLGSDPFESHAPENHPTTPDKKIMVKKTPGSEAPARITPDLQFPLPEFKPGRIDIGPTSVTPAGDEALVAGKETSPFGSTHPSGH